MSCHPDHSPATTFFQIKSITSLSRYQLRNKFASREYIREGPFTWGETLSHFIVAADLGGCWAFGYVIILIWPKEETEAQAC